MKYILVTPRLRRSLPPDMIIHDYDIGDGVKVDVVSLRDLMINMGLDQDDMDQIDKERQEKGLPAMFQRQLEEE